MPAGSPKGETAGHYVGCGVLVYVGLAEWVLEQKTSRVMCCATCLNSRSSVTNDGSCSGSVYAITNTCAAIAQ